MPWKKSFLKSKPATVESAVTEVKTYWNGEPCKARIVHVIVGKSPKPTWWCADLEGTEREAVEIAYGNMPLAYIDNANGEGWDKVTIGRGSPQWPHSSLPVAKVIEPPKHAKPTCPKCDSIMYIKVKRYTDGKLLIRCLDCEHEGTMTNEEYYGHD